MLLNPFFGVVNIVQVRQTLVFLRSLDKHLLLYLSKL